RHYDDRESTVSALSVEARCRCASTDILTPLYSELQIERIEETIATLERRIGERFPGSGLSRVSAELLRLAKKTEGVIALLRRPIWILRVGTVVGVAGIVAITVALLLVAFRTSLR